MALHQPCKKRHHPDDEEHLASCLKRPLVTWDAGLSSSIHSDLDSITCSEAMPKAWNPPSRANLPYTSSMEPGCTGSSYMTTSEVSSMSVGLAFQGSVLAGTKPNTFESLSEGKSRGRWLPDPSASESSRFDSEGSEVTTDRTQKWVSLMEGVVSSNQELPSGSMWRSLAWQSSDVTRHQAAGTRFSDQRKYVSGAPSAHTGSMDLRWQARQGKAKLFSSIMEESGSSCEETIRDSPFEGKWPSHKLELPNLWRKRFPIAHGASREVQRKEKSWITWSSCEGEKAEGTMKGPRPSYVLSSGGLSLEEDGGHESDVHGAELDNKQTEEKPCVSYVLSSGRLSLADDGSRKIDTLATEDDERTADECRPSYVLSSGRLSLEEEARLGRRAPTIDHDFEEYFSALML